MEEAMAQHLKNLALPVLERHSWTRGKVKASFTVCYLKILESHHVRSWLRFYLAMTRPHSQGEKKGSIRPKLNNNRFFRFFLNLKEINSFGALES